MVSAFCSVVQTMLAAAFMWVVAKLLVWEIRQARERRRPRPTITLAATVHPVSPDHGADIRVAMERDNPRWN